MDNLFWLSFLATIVLFLLGISIGRKTHLYHPSANLENAHTKSKIFIFIILVIFISFLSMVILVRNDTILETTPLLFQKFSTLFMWTFFAMLVTFTSGYIGAIALFIKKPIMSYIPSLLLLNTLFFILFFRINQPIYTLVSSTPPKNNGFLQSTNYSCTSASIATIALQYNKKIDEKYIAYISGLSKFGATSAQIRYTLNKLHLNYTTLINTALKLNKIEPPAIIYIDHPSLGVESHAVAYLDYNYTSYKVWDPLQGTRVILKSEMNHIWHGNGIKVYLPIKAL